MASDTSHLAWDKLFECHWQHCQAIIIQCIEKDERQTMCDGTDSSYIGHYHLLYALCGECTIHWVNIFGIIHIVLQSII